MFHFLVIFFFAALQFVPPNAEWSPWNHWSLCFEHSSAIFAQIRTRACLGGNANTCHGSDTQARACLPAERPIKRDEYHPQTTPFPSIVQANAEWTHWSKWTECQSIPTGSSRPFRTRWRICDRRKCEMAEAIKCILCNGAPLEQRNCVEPAAPMKKHREQCQWNEWSAWSPCSTNCGSGTHFRVRNCPCQKCSPDGLYHEEKICYNLLPCFSNQPLQFTTATLSMMPLLNISKTQLMFDPCRACPPNYPFPCYTCLKV